MTDDEATETLRAAISQAFDGRLIGDFVVAANVYATDQPYPAIAVHAADGMSLSSQIGLLTSALNRANAVDQSGWRDGWGDE